MKQWVKLIILTSVLTFATTSIVMAKFDDVKENSVYEKAINSLSEKGILNGYPDNTFKPDGKIKRGEFAKLLSFMNNLKVNEGNKKEFEDIAGHWAKSYIEVAASNNLLKGYEDNSFKPEKQITYGEVATILLRTLNIFEVNKPNMSWPDDCMDYAQNIGLFDGVETNDLLGMNPARRDNVALMIWNTINYAESVVDPGSGDEASEKNVSGDKGTEDKEEVNQIPEKVDTKSYHVGVVDKITIKRGDKKYITVINIDGDEEEIKLYSKCEEPKFDSVIVYKYTSNGEMNLKKQLLASDIANVAFVVEDVDDELVKLKDEDKLLDLSLDKFNTSSTEIKLNKYTYYLVNMTDDEENVFGSLEALNFSNLKLRKDDRLCFDEDTKIALVIRGLE